MQKTKNKGCGCCTKAVRCACCGKCENCGVDHWGFAGRLDPFPYPVYPPLLPTDSYGIPYEIPYGITYGGTSSAVDNQVYGPGPSVNTGTTFTCTH